MVAWLQKVKQGKRPAVTFDALTVGIIFCNAIFSAVAEAMQFGRNLHPNNYASHRIG
jgi:hypothetical protein